MSSLDRQPTPAATETHPAYEKPTLEALGKWKAVTLAQSVGISLLLPNLDDTNRLG